MLIGSVLEVIVIFGGTLSLLILNCFSTSGELLETFGERYGEDNEHGDQLISVMKRLLSGPNRIWALAALD